MYDRRLKCWTAPKVSDAELRWCREPFNQNNPKALFLMADQLLARNTDTADAVYAMERAAKLNHPRAAFALGQMYHYGWAVHRSRKEAERWYETAARLGSPEAAQALASLRRQRLLAALGFGALGLTAAAGIVILAFFPGLLGILPDGVKVHRDSELITATTTLEFSQALTDLIAENDTDLMVTGQQSTNRLILRFEGSGIDLSAFPASTVISREGDNYVIIQFTSEEEAAQCLAALEKMENVTFVETDQYSSSIGDGDTMSVTGAAPVYTSPYTGFDYYSWGVEFLGMDQTAAWLISQNTTPVTVAVIDTGAEYHDAFADRLLPGADMTDPANPNGWSDTQGHGTHVSGTILDCTQGLDVRVLPVRVFQGETTAYSLIAAGVRYAVEQDVDVINMSLSGGCSFDLEYEVENALSQDIVVVVAAGNDALDVDSWSVCPAHIPGCITVSACQWDAGLYYYTNYGDSVDVCAPGVDVLSYCINGALACKTGTSMASPHIAALSAMLRLYLPDRTNAQIAKYIGDYGINPGDPLFYGAGIPDASCFAGD